MKKIIFPLLFIAFACNNAGKKNGEEEGLKAQADSLYKETIDEHNKGMAGWMKIEGRQKQIQQLIDSIGRLPAKAQSTLAALKTSLDKATAELQDAYTEMETWMEKMNLDSAADNLQLRIEYLANEKLKGSKITDLINNSLQKADSLLKTKF